MGCSARNLQLTIFILQVADGLSRKPQVFADMAKAMCHAAAALILLVENLPAVVAPHSASETSSIG